MDRLRTRLYGKRKATEDNIRELDKWDRAGNRYTCMLSDVSSFACSIVAYIGMAMYLVSEIVYLYNYGKAFDKAGIAFEIAQYSISVLMAISLIVVIYLDRIKQKEIATRRQKNLGFGLMVLTGLLGYIVSIMQILVVARSGISAPRSLILVGVGALAVFAFSLPIYVSYKKGIFYRCK